jgi:hypothetical protein
MPRHIQNRAQLKELCDVSEFSEFQPSEWTGLRILSNPWPRDVRNSQIQNWEWIWAYLLRGIEGRALRNTSLSNDSQIVIIRMSDFKSEMVDLSMDRIDYLRGWLWGDFSEVCIFENVIESDSSHLNCSNINFIISTSYHSCGLWLESHFSNQSSHLWRTRCIQSYSFPITLRSAFRNNETWRFIALKGFTGEVTSFGICGTTVGRVGWRDTCDLHAPTDR